MHSLLLGGDDEDPKTGPVIPSPVIMTLRSGAPSRQLSDVLLDGEKKSCGVKHKLKTGPFIPSPVIMTLRSGSQSRQLSSAAAPKPLKTGRYHFWLDMALHPLHTVVCGM